MTISLPLWDVDCLLAGFFPSLTLSGLTDAFHPPLSAARRVVVVSSRLNVRDLLLAYVSVEVLDQDHQVFLFPFLFSTRV